jgi:hypothetical protein
LILYNKQILQERNFPVFAKQITKRKLGKLALHTCLKFK